MIFGATGDASKFHHKWWGITASVSGIDFQSTVVSSARIPVTGSEDPHSHGGSQFMIQPHDVQVTTSRAIDWSGDASSTAVMNDS